MSQESPIHDDPNANRKSKPECEIVVRRIHRTYGYNLQLLKRQPYGGFSVVTFGPFTTKAEALALEESCRPVEPNDDLAMYDDGTGSMASGLLGDFGLLGGKLEGCLPLRMDHLSEENGHLWDTETKTGVCRVVTNEQVLDDDLPTVTAP